MQIAYFLDWKFEPELGVPSKVLMQISAWQQLGHDVELYAIVPAIYETRWRFLYPRVKLQNYNSALGRYLSRTKTVRLMLNESFTFVYMRFGIFMPSQLRLIRRFPTVLEINTINRQEALHRGKWFRILNFFSERYGIDSCLCACAVTQEITEKLIENNPALRVKAFSNSIQLRDIPILSRAENIRPQLVFVGSPDLKWHGIDKLLKIASVNTDYDFHIIGATSSISPLQNIFLYPPKFGKELYEILERMDIAISSLALERNHINQGSPLKTRLYLACGLPVIASYEDCGVNSSTNAFLNLGSGFLDDITLTNERISEFVKFWKGKRVERSTIDSIDSANVEKLRLAYIEENLRF